MSIEAPYCQPYEAGRIADSGILSSSRRPALARIRRPPRSDQTNSRPPASSRPNRTSRRAEHAGQEPVVGAAKDLQLGRRAAQDAGEELAAGAVQQELAAGQLVGRGVALGPTSRVRASRARPSSGRLGGRPWGGLSGADVRGDVGSRPCRPARGARGGFRRARGRASSRSASRREAHQSKNDKGPERRAMPPRPLKARGTGSSITADAVYTPILTLTNTPHHAQPPSPPHPARSAAGSGDTGDIRSTGLQLASGENDSDSGGDRLCARVRPSSGDSDGAIMANHVT